MTSVCKKGGEKVVWLYTIGTGVSMVYTQDYTRTPDVDMAEVC